MKHYPAIHSLKTGHWFKLICGASYQHLPSIRNLAIVYTLAGADCLDVAADPAVIATVQEGLTIAQEWRDRAIKKGFTPSNPILMVSLNDGEDPHFRKAEFDPNCCPPDCPRPCEAICPAEAINSKGVVVDRCYGCGRCLPVCPQQLIDTFSWVATGETIMPLIKQGTINAIEIHTQVGHFSAFQKLWQTIKPIQSDLKILAISCPDDPNLISYLTQLSQLISPLQGLLIWQTDGRPMSGDIGKGTTHATVKLAQKVLKANLPGYVQLAGGTNQHTVMKLKQLKLLNRGTADASIAGVAYGSYARSRLVALFQQLESQLSQNLENTPTPVALKVKIEDFPQLLWQGVSQAHTLVSQIKTVTSTP